MRNTPTAETKQRIVEMYRAGHTMREIQHQTNCKSVHRILHSKLPDEEIRALVKSRHLGERNPNYKVGVYYTAGYRYVLKPTWYTGKLCGGSYAAEHHVALLPLLGLTELPKDTVVHHVDGDKLNNDTTNLVLMDDTEHRAMHLTRTMKGTNHD